MKILLLLAVFLVSCAELPKENVNNKIIVSVKDQRAKVVVNNKVVKEMVISTGKGGTGDIKGSHATPLGKMRIVDKIGDGLPLMTGFKHGVPTKNVNGTDPILTRVLKLVGLEKQNQKVYSRGILAHATPYVDKLGQAVSMGCLRFSPLDMLFVFNSVSIGSIIEIY